MAAETVFSATTRWVADIDPGPRKILAHRYPDVPNLGDVTAIDWATVPPVDIITGGSPCQDLSTAGKRAGMTAGTRSNLWVAMREAIAALQPKLVIWENVRGALSAAAHSAMEPCPGCMGDDRPGPVLRALGRVLGDLAELGYDAQWCGLRAADVGAPHGRFRVFLLATDTSRVGGNEALERDGRGAQGRYGRGVPDQRDRELVRTGPDRDLTLLPTPSACVANDGESPATWLERRERVKEAARNGNGMGMPLSIAAQLLQTPSVADATGGHERRGGKRGGELLLNGQVKEIASLLPTPRTQNNENRQSDGYGPNLGESLREWGRYADAIARWETIHGPAPAPTMTSPRTGNQQLSPAFTEWMMGLPAGWVTDVPGVTRNEALKLCGNGVVPQQATAALRHLAGMANAMNLAEQGSLFDEESA